MWCIFDLASGVAFFLTLCDRIDVGEGGHQDNRGHEEALLPAHHPERGDFRWLRPAGLAKKMEREREEEDEALFFNMQIFLYYELGRRGTTMQARKCPLPFLHTKRGPLPEEECIFSFFFTRISAAASKIEFPTNIASVNLVMGCCKVFFFTILTATLAY